MNKHSTLARKVISTNQPSTNNRLLAVLELAGEGLRFADFAGSVPIWVNPAPAGGIQQTSTQFLTTCPFVVCADTTNNNGQLSSAFGEFEPARFGSVELVLRGSEAGGQLRGARGVLRVECRVAEG